MRSVDHSQPPIHSQKRLDIQIIGREDDVKQHLLRDVQECLFPFAKFRRSPPSLIGGLVRVRRTCRIVSVMVTELEDLYKRVNRTPTSCGHGSYLVEDSGSDVGERNRVVALANI